MPNFNLSFDMRAPDFGTPAAEIYAEALDMVEYCDSHGMDYTVVMEHHGTKDNYLPTPFVMGAAAAARSKRMRITLGAVILPLHDPVEVAEQIAVLDLISNGRVDVVFGAGYVRSEFDMFRASLHERGKALDTGVPLIQRALSGERFTADGREIFIRPLSVQKPHPPFFMGGGVAATARRAARFGAGLWPLNPDVIALYRDECAKLGCRPGRIIFNIGMIHVTNDPDKTWAQVAPHILHYTQAYAELTEGASSSSPFQGMTTLEAVKAAGIYRVVTPDECVKMCAEADTMGADFGLAPLIAGLDPKVGWESLELFFDKVLPRVKKAA
jgi:alkanesulfonate monooxygenase SsuD/methylene tetrahydromethanopterin reductase-like flavin-dependent oxidoreductase (luciferase family)